MLSNRLRNFIAEKLDMPPETLAAGNRLQHDLGLDGADAAEFMASFGQTFGVEMSEFVLTDYFGRESAGCFPLWIVWLLIPPLRPKVTALTIGDLERALQAGRWPSKARLVRRKTRG
jgi:acyl carrier protein